ncbi:MAG: hypothetical protein WCB68_17530 [Pyrinomonadaceae bacterium]
MISQQEELELLRQIARAARAFQIGYFAPIHAADPRQFHPGTITMMELVAPALDRLAAEYPADVADVVVETSLPEVNIQDRAEAAEL